MATWTLVPISAGNNNGPWVTESGSGTIYDQTDEGIAGADSTGIKGTTSASGTFECWMGLTAKPSDLGAVADISAVSIRIRCKQSGRVDDTAVTITAFVGRSNGASESSYGSVAQDVTSVTSYTNSTLTDITTAFKTLTLSELSTGLWVRVRQTKTTSMSADSITYFLDCVEIVVTYTPSARAPNYGFVHHNNPGIL